MTDMPLEMMERFSACSVAWTAPHKFELLTLHGKLLATVFWAAPVNGSSVRYSAYLNGEHIESKQPMAFVNKLHKAVTRSFRR